MLIKCQELGQEARMSWRGSQSLGSSNKSRGAEAQWVVPAKHSRPGRRLAACPAARSPREPGSLGYRPAAHRGPAMIQGGAAMQEVQWLSWTTVGHVHPRSQTRGPWGLSSPAPKSYVTGTSGSVWSPRHHESSSACDCCAYWKRCSRCPQTIVEGVSLLCKGTLQ